MPMHMLLKVTCTQYNMAIRNQMYRYPVIGNKLT